MGSGAFRRLLPSVLLTLFCLVSFARGAALAEGRTALVIGNSAYPTAPLKNPVNDATDMAAALGRLGFDVTLLKNAGMQQMETAVREFGLKLRKGGLGLFYFAGHGVQVAGENYLVPVNAVIQSEGDVKYGCLNAGLVLAKMEDAGNGPNIVILDACRNNPFARSFRGAESGLARMDAPTGSIIAYATAPGKVAADGDGRNGLYTQYLLKNIATPGLSISDMFMNVRVGVVRDSGKKQVPWENTSLIGRFSLAGQVAAPAPAPTPAPQASLAPKPAPAASVPAGPAAPAISAEESKLMAELSAYRGTKRDEDVEAGFLARAKPLAAKGSPYGRFALAWLGQDEIARNQAVAQAAKRNIPLALVLRAEYLAEQPVSPADEAEARALLRQAMDMGEPEARLDLARLLIQGKGGPKDIAGGERLFAELVRDRPAYGEKVALAYFELSEKDLPKADAEAKGVAYARRAASQGSIEAMMLLAELYERGSHVKKDPYEAWTWYEKAAGRGYTWAMTTMAMAYQFGNADLGVKQDGVVAMNWYLKAAHLGNKSASVSIAEMYIEGQGVPKDTQRGMAMLKELADGCNDQALYALGKKYALGLGVPKNTAQAYYWLLLQKRCNSSSGEFLLNETAEKLPPAERARMDALAAKWRPKGGKAAN